MVVIDLKNQSELFPSARGFHPCPLTSPLSYFVANNTSHRIPSDVATGFCNFLSASKVAALRGFWEAVGGGGKVVVWGTSLEDAATIKFALGDGPDRHQGLCERHSPCCSSLCRWPAQASLHDCANRISYFDPDTYATNDAL